MSRLLRILVLVLSLIALSAFAVASSNCTPCRMYADRLNQFLAVPRREQDFIDYLDKLHREIPRSDAVFKKLKSMGKNRVKDDLNKYYHQTGSNSVCAKWGFC